MAEFSPDESSRQPLATIGKLAYGGSEMRNYAQRSYAMWRRLLVLAGLVASAGCITPDDRREWAAAMRDLRGDNMRLQSGPGPDTGSMSKLGD